MQLLVKSVLFAVVVFCNKFEDHPCALLEDPDSLLAESSAIAESGRPYEAYACLNAGSEKFAEFADIWVSYKILLDPDIVESMRICLYIYVST